MPEHEDESEEEEEITETMFTFDAFEQVCSSLTHSFRFSSGFAEIRPSRCHADIDVVFGSIQGVSLSGEYEAYCKSFTSPGRESKGRGSILQGMMQKVILAKVTDKHD